MAARTIFLMVVLCSSLFSFSQEYKNTGLPVCYIETESGQPIVSKAEYIRATLYIKDGDTFILDTLPISIRVRGNSTRGYPKKPYKIKFASKTRPFPEMSKDKSFVLLANYTDKSLMRTAIGFKVGELLEFGWIPRSRYVEVVLNGEYIGNYQFTENVKRNSERIDITKKGFIIEFDFDYLSSIHYFSTVINEWKFTPKYPEDDEMIDSIFSYAERYMNSFEEALYKPEFPSDRSYLNYIDETSFAKWYYWKNILQMDECNRYYYKRDDTDDTKLEMGPIWDFEWCLGVGPGVKEERPSTKYYLENKLYFSRLYHDPLFMAKVAEIHKQYYDKVLNGILDFYDVLSDSLRLSQDENFRRWPILDKPISWNYVPMGAWEEEVACDKEFFVSHYEWLNDKLTPYLTVNGVVEVTRDQGHPTDRLNTVDGRAIAKRPTGKGVYISRGRKYILH